MCAGSVYNSAMYCIHRGVFQMQEWYIKRLDGPGAGWQGEGQHGEGGDDGDWSR